MEMLNEKTENSAKTLEANSDRTITYIKHKKKKTTFKQIIVPVQNTRMKI